MARKSLSCCVRTTTRRSSGCWMPSAWSANPDLGHPVAENRKNNGNPIGKGSR